MTAYSLIANLCNSGCLQQSIRDLVDEQISALDDVLLITAFIDYCKNECKFNITEWLPPREGYPPYMFLGGDRGILAYFDFHCAIVEGPLHDDLLRTSSKRILNTITKADSHLDRPVFFIYIISADDVRGVFFETNEQIKDRWLNSGFSEESYSPELEEMGTIDNLFALMNDLKRNSVRFS